MTIRWSSHDDDCTIITYPLPQAWSCFLLIGLPFIRTTKISSVSLLSIRKFWSPVVKCRQRPSWKDFYCANKIYGIQSSQIDLMPFFSFGHVTVHEQSGDPETEQYLQIEGLDQHDHPKFTMRWRWERRAMLRYTFQPFFPCRGP